MVRHLYRNRRSYLKYFNEDHCQLCDDILEEEYDLDFIGIIPLYSKLVTIEELVQQSPLGKESRQKVLNDCNQLKIDKGNAIFFYSGEKREIKQGEIFNQIVYIGEYSV